MWAAKESFDRCQLSNTVEYLRQACLVAYNVTSARASTGHLPTACFTFHPVSGSVSRREVEEGVQELIPGFLPHGMFQKNSNPPFKPWHVYKSLEKGGSIRGHVRSSSWETGKNARVPLLNLLFRHASTNQKPEVHFLHPAKISINQNVSVGGCYSRCTLALEMVTSWHQYPCSI